VTDERVEDLDVPESDSEDVKGGALNQFLKIDPKNAPAGNTKWGDIELKRGLD
jgi:hypothetical protein